MTSRKSRARFEREVALALGNCDSGCWTERKCPTCGLRVPPRGCSIPLEASGSYCECECTLAENDRHLWDVHDSNRAYTDPDGWIAHVNSCDRCEGAPWPCHADVLLDIANGAP